jgi:hypothetical protein
VRPEDFRDPKTLKVAWLWLILLLTGLFAAAAIAWLLAKWSGL